MDAFIELTSEFSGKLPDGAKVYGVSKKVSHDDCLEFLKKSKKPTSFQKEKVELMFSDESWSNNPYDRIILPD